MNRKYLIPLDCLMDTRAGTLACLDEEYLNRILAGGTPYFSRIIDDFDWLGKDVTKKYKERHEARDMEVLQKSFMTALVPYMTRIITSIMLEAHEHPQWNGVAVDVNYWPYKLTSNQKEVFKDAILRAIGGEDENGDVLLDFEIQMVNIPLAELTMEDMKKNWNAVFMYDFIQWTDLHAEEFREGELTAIEVEVHVPTLFRVMIDKATLRKPDGGHINPFYETKRHFALWFNLHYTNPRIFSIPDPDELKAPPAP